MTLAVASGCQTQGALDQADAPAAVAEPLRAASTPSDVAAVQRAQVDELVGRLAPRLSRSAEGLVEHDEAVHLQGRFQHGVVAHRGPDGRMHTECVADAAGLERALMRDAASGRP